MSVNFTTEITRLNGAKANLTFNYLKGATGATGAQGPKGDKGDTGSTGSVSSLTTSGSGNVVTGVSLNTSTKVLTVVKGSVAPAYTYGTSDLTAGSSSLATGTLYFVYE